ncbi:mucin-3B-like [Chiloscyllium plagiosum]|uniref:mucin-3B-like n=1 Tax=Chiloscyllium plagiosum TaxID=36176 RepID=UPI001CB83D38|nr:mucin-3B-like [Chiloscyllium plagiosum]
MEDKMDNTGQTEQNWDAVEISVNISVRIINQKYTTELNDITSSEFQNFESDFKQQMDIIYNDIEGYAGVKITSIRNGSIIVDHDIIINMTNPAELTPEYLSETIKDIEVKLKETTCNNATQGNSTRLVLDPGYLKVEAVVTGDCASQVPENLKQHYELTVTNNGAICASICNEARKDSLKCGNGKCGMTNKGAKCYCDLTGSYWYLGDFCNIPIHKNGLIGGLSATLILFLLGLIAFAVYMVWFRRSRKHYFREREDEQIKIIAQQWAEDDFEYCNPSTITVANREDTSFDNSTGERKLTDFSIVNVKPELNSKFNFKTEQVKIQRPQMNVYNTASHL